MKATIKFYTVLPLLKNFNHVDSVISPVTFSGTNSHKSLHRITTLTTSRDLYYQALALHSNGLQNVDLPLTQLAATFSPSNAVRLWQVGWILCLARAFPCHEKCLQSHSSPDPGTGLI